MNQDGRKRHILRKVLIAPATMLWVENERFDEAAHMVKMSVK